MSLRCVICFLVLQSFSILSVAADKSLEKQLASSKQVMNNGNLTFASGRYSLEKGKANTCPDGEFTGGDGFLVVGANQKIANINKGPQITNKECHEVREAKLNGKNLAFTQVEDCGEDSVNQSTYTFRFYQTPTKAYIDLDIKSLSQSMNEADVPSSLHCLYSRSL